MHCLHLGHAEYLACITLALYVSAAIMSGINAQHRARRAQAPLANWAWLADAATPGSAAAGACEEQPLGDLPPAFLEGGWATLGVRCACLLSGACCMASFSAVWKHAL